MTLLALALALAQDSGGCDLDGDGYDAFACGGDDCSDEADSIHPEATEIPGDGIDQDCDTLDAAPPIGWVDGGRSCGGILILLAPLGLMRRLVTTATPGNPKGGA